MGVKGIDIVFTINSLMDQAGAFGNIYIIRCIDSECMGVFTGCTILACCRAVRKVRENRIVPPAFKVGTFQRTDHCVIVADLFSIPREKGCSEIQFFTGEFARNRFNLAVLDIRPHNYR